MKSSSLTKESLKRKNFTPDDFFVSSTAKKLGLNNYPAAGADLSILTCLMSTADMLQAAYDILESEHFSRKNKAKFGIKINSVYRSYEVNAAVKGSRNSQHCQGLAADITSSFGTPEEIMKFLHSIGFLVDQCFSEGSWLHISRCLPIKVTTKNPNRMMYGYFLPDASGNRKFKAI